MRNPFVPRVGGVLSADIAVPDHERELHFYSKVLTSGDDPLWRDDLMNNLGVPVIGLGERTPEYEDLPLQWMPHFQVADVGRSAARAIEMGGNEIMHAKTDDGQSQWAVLTDQFGAAFGMIPVVDALPESSGQKDRQGCISWLSLTVPDASSSRDFYQQVIGWNPVTMETSGHEDGAADFEMRIDEDVAAAEIRNLRREGSRLPAAWMIHLPVGDIDESLRRVGAGGGEVIDRQAGAHGALIRDPVGVYLALQAG